MVVDYEYRTELNNYLFLPNVYPSFSEEIF